MTNPPSVVERFRQADAARDAALNELVAAAATYIDAHPDLDTTGEWERMRGIFGAKHVQSWNVDVDEDRILLHKTTNRGYFDHDIWVSLRDLAGGSDLEAIAEGRP